MTPEQRAKIEREAILNFGVSVPCVDFIIDLTLAAVLALLDAKIAELENQKRIPRGCSDADECYFVKLEILRELRAEIEGLK